MKNASDDSTFSVHARSLQNLIEKVTVFREVTKYEDTEQNLTGSWKLSPLYDKYAEYADVVAAHGQLSVAEKYLDLLPVQYPAAEVARNRVKQASTKATPKQVTRQQSTMAPATQRTSAQPMAYQPAQPMQTMPPAQTNAYQPQAQNQYGQQNQAPAANNPYAPSNTGMYAPQQSFQQQNKATLPPPPQPGMAYQQTQAFGGPPRNMSSSPSMALPPRTGIPSWNDTPMVVKPPLSRRGTPAAAAAAITSPFPAQQNVMSPPPGPPFGVQQSGPPPPPKAGAPPPRMASPAGQVQQNRQSSVANQYAPFQQAVSQPSMGPPPSSIQRGPSPYNAPSSRSTSHQ